MSWPAHRIDGAIDRALHEQHIVGAVAVALVSRSGALR
jgi:hypothetical protein